MGFSVEQGHFKVDNQSGLPDEEVEAVLLENPQIQEIVNSKGAYADKYSPEVANLSSHIRETGDSLGGPSRGRRVAASASNFYHMPVDAGIYKQMVVAQAAAEKDDIVSGILDTTESLALKDVTIEIPDSTWEENLWKEIAKDMDLADVFRQQHRDQYTYSQGYAVLEWGVKEYTVDGLTKEGKPRKKTFKGVKVPISSTVINPQNILPVSPTINSISSDMDYLYLCFCPREERKIDRVLDPKDEKTDGYISNFITEKLSDNDMLEELMDVGDLGVDMPIAIYRTQNVYGFGLTTSSYSRFSTVRMASIFDLLDLKANLKVRDRAQLIGSASIIITVKKGSEEQPATQGEIDELHGLVSNLARVPIIVSDHRLDVEIASYKDQTTLAAEKYNNIDARITARLFHQFVAGNYTAGTSKDSSASFIKVASQALETHRSFLVDAFVKNVVKKVMTLNSELVSEPKILILPRRVSMDYDPKVFQQIMDLRDRGDVSRETMLNYLDLSQGNEAKRRELEADQFDKFFPMPQVPYTSLEQQTTPQTEGRKGGGQNNESFKDNGNENS